eukprot:scaffold11248_cov121-Skeletonema_marinoi.AAC.1
MLRVKQIFIGLCVAGAGFRPGWLHFCQEVQGRRQKGEWRKKDNLKKYFRGQTVWSRRADYYSGARLSGGMHNSNPYQTKSCSRTHTMISLSDLPTGALAHVSSYLASPLSCALFAAALNHRDVDSSTAITGSQWDALDFGHIEKELAAKLTDDDISAVLTYIDAVNNIKKLRLTNCINIKMVPYSMSACQVVRVFCAVLRALGTSPIMALGIVFLTGYPTCARPLPPLLFCAPRRFSKIFLSFGSTKTTMARWYVSCAYKATAGS